MNRVVHPQFHVPNVNTRDEGPFGVLNVNVFLVEAEASGGAHGEGVNFLGFIVGKNGAEVDEEKVKAIREWPTPKNASDVRSFHGLASFNRRFIKNFSAIAAPLNNLVKKHVAFEWGEKQEKAFKELKEKLMNAPLLVLPNFERTFEIECEQVGWA
ncbi:Retrovirus-related Pol polyprotein from transposon 17.6 [Cucumis melo var. makuwa]|uniref:Retrovirus-related Pol polyprotein from transposon 17.6 n=1 Tax=Cucumis melo var. makuwa TaxID=1194695 RepID=A0A5A7VQ92_CUCMM|nr:Retrovirus-related Pol polyprotein from transposon 17.6 [Cucumis melo var. makuwa]TYK14907.1 Retrovirus-related Pol polyprotein from transposon 17.6 [Cucumis melo var. makuwa]